MEVVCDDFFEHKPLPAGGYDFIWDVTFLCALDPSVRERWATQHRQLLSKGGALMTGIFPIGKPPGGPPYALSVDLLKSLLVPVGFAATEIREELPAAEQHSPGAFGSNSPFKTALATWKLL